jgi:hypothetical protein
MQLSPGVSPGNLAAALKRFEEAVGKDWVFASDERMRIRTLEARSAR